MSTQNDKNKTSVDKRIEELMASIENFLERTKKIELELARKKRKIVG